NHTCLLRSILPSLIIGTQGEQAQMSQSHLTAQVHSSTSGTDSGRPIPKKSQSHLTAQVHSSGWTGQDDDGTGKKSQSHLTAQVHSSIYSFLRDTNALKEVAIPPDCSGPFLLTHLPQLHSLYSKKSQSHLTAQVHSSCCLRKLPDSKHLQCRFPLPPKTAS